MSATRPTLARAAALCAALLALTACASSEPESPATSSAAATTTEAETEVERTDEVSTVLTEGGIAADNLTGAFERSGRLELKTTIAEGNNGDADTEWGISACQAVVDALSADVIVREADSGIFVTNVKPASKDGTCVDY